MLSVLESLGITIQRDFLVKENLFFNYQTEHFSRPGADGTPGAVYRVIKIGVDILGFMWYNSIRKKQRKR